MKYRTLIHLILLINIGVLPVYSQDTINWHLQTTAVASTNEIVPLWLYTNQYGTINNFGHGELLLLGGMNWNCQLKKNIHISAGIEAFSSNEINRSNINQLYAQLKWDKFVLSIGKKNFSNLLDTEKEISFLDFRNIQPFPALTLGFPKYTPIPFTFEAIEFKAMGIQGFLDDNRHDIGVNKPLYHFKNLYLKSGLFPVHIFAGINHAVIFGGTLADGTKIPSNIIDAYLTKGSEKVSEVNYGDGINVVGENLAMTEYGISFENESFLIAISKQDPATDYSGLVRSKDMIVNLTYESVKKEIISKLSYQYAYFKDQSGPGIHLNKYENIDDYSQYLYDEYGINAQVETWEEFHTYLEELVNHGYNEFGRDDYFNHSVYRLDHFYNNHFFGYPLMSSNEQAQYFKNMDNPSDEIIVNNRIIAHNLSILGWINERFNYKTIISLTNNFGTYSGTDAGDPNPREDYYFFGGKKQNYLSLEFNYQLKKRPIQVQTKFGADFGELYDSFGMLIGIRYSGIL